KVPGRPHRSVSSLGQNVSDPGTCNHCGSKFAYDLLHNGFNDSAYAYCDRCGTLAILDGWKIPTGIQCRIHENIPVEVEEALTACSCGGRFRRGSSPRCPACAQPLPADSAAVWIEANAPGTAKGWRWQRNWTGL